MKRFAASCLHNQRAPRWILVAGLALTLCSCRSLAPQGKTALPADKVSLVSEEVPAEPPVLATDVAAQTADHTPHMPVECVSNDGLPIPVTCMTPWAPPGIAGPWPHDEYLCDGGDGEVIATIGPEGELRGMELEDTVAVYNTADGPSIIKPSNKVCLYAPRFAAVRKVTSLFQNEQREQLVGVDRPVGPHEHLDDQLVTTAVQPIMPEGEIGTKQPSLQRVNEGTLPAISELPIAAVNGEVSLHQGLLVLRNGIFQESEVARLALANEAAITWSHDKAVQVMINGTEAVSLTGDQRVQETFRIETPNSPCLRIIKTASTKMARPGEIVDFTLRFDNLGDQTIQHVTIVDNLTTRLEYVPDTQQSSRRATFSTQVNDGDSLVLRWDFAEPLPVGAGGLIRFHCKVR